MYLLKFEILKLVKSTPYLLVLLLPIGFLFLLLVHFMTVVDQPAIETKLFLFKGESLPNLNPYYHFSSQFLMGFYLLIFPVQSILAFGIGHQLDLNYRGWMLVKSIHPSPWKWHLQSWFAHTLLLLGSLLLVGCLFSVILIALPQLLPSLNFTGQVSPTQMMAVVFYIGFLTGLPLLILHYWIAFLSSNISVSLMCVFLLMVVTYSIHQTTPYYLLSGTVASRLTLVEHYVILGKGFTIFDGLPWRTTELIPVLSVTLFCLIHACFKGR